VEIYPQSRPVTLFLKLDPDQVDLEDGFTHDVRNVGHFGTGDLQVTLRSMADFEKAQPLLQRAYEGG
jgi:predicted transport protein